MPIKCVIVVADAKSRQALRSALENESDIEIIAEADSPAEALEKVRQVRTDILLIDTSKLGTTGLEAARLMTKDSEGTRLIFVAVQEEEEDLRRCLDVGASGYIAKDASAARLIGAVRDVHQGRKYLSPQFLGKLVDSLRFRQAPLGQAQAGILTPRELEVLKMIAEGKSVKEIAHQLGLSIKTVDAHKSNLMRKLDIHNKVQLVIYAIQNQILKLPTEH
ncbi:MAG TPA: response regulator transcription factor [Terriglobales bacterium]|nr:response regulator transcription factor [Terriglobales bacterium]